ncbi:PD-(D/E)XK motif protein [Streptomyces pratensis]|uniref:PD-(D/E)XK motif protein n=1 Tax=Streptomyces pratensis TaxID=1169025 RepID=UPI0030160A49
MSDETLRRIVENSWHALEAEQATAERRLRTTPLPVDTEQGPLTAAVDHDGHRHLLIPVPANRKIRTNPDGPVLRLSGRALEDADTYQSYADLMLLEGDFGDLFTGLCVDVLDATRESPHAPIKALYGVLDRWKALFRAQRALLTPDQVVGLFGELTILKRLLERDPGAHRLWHGPSGYRHDFWGGATAVEVKASTSPEGRRPRIHGLDQLEAPAGGELWLAWFRLQRVMSAGVGTGFTELIGQTLYLCDDEQALLDLLAGAGFRPTDTDRYRNMSFLIGEERWYRVTPDFPGLTGEALASAGLTISALDVAYSIDLSGETPVPLPDDEVRAVLDRLPQEST